MNIGAQNDDHMLKNEDGEDEDKNQEETEEGTISIPWGYIRERPSTRYKGTDPEWKSFEDFAKDRKKMGSVQGNHLC